MAYRLQEERIGVLTLAESWSPLTSSWHLHIGRRHKPNLMAKGCQLTRPEMGGGARLHANQAGRQAAEEADELTSAELTADQNLSIPVNTVDLEHMLCEIETNSRDMHRSGSLSGAEAITLSHRALPGAGAVHSILYGTGNKPLATVLL
jgi:hypothetical protein